MALFFLDEDPVFPPAGLAEPDGLLAIGGDLGTKRLLNAYANGIFPWYDEDPILWWSPDPRFVLFPEELKVSKSMRTILNGCQFRFSTNEAFRDVIGQCRNIKRNGQEGTWINENMLEAYTLLHKLGYAHSAEAWQGNELVGGLYGIRMGRLFFGESMFSKVSNASKFSFVHWVKLLQEQGVVLIDCQVYTAHLESMGAKMISRQAFLDILKENLPPPPSV